MKVAEIKLAQQYLAKANLYNDTIDGKQGNNTNKAILAALTQRASRLPDDWQQWPDKRKAIAYLQLISDENNIESGDIDGFYGPQTEYAIERLTLLSKTGSLPRGFPDIVPIRANPHDFPQEGLQSLTDHYGEPCQGETVLVRCPWDLRLDWDLATPTHNIRIHRSLRDSLATVLEKIFDHYGEQTIKDLGLDRYGGSFNCRKKRGSTQAWSTHAWGIAIDWFPSKNKLKWDSEKASLARPELDDWWEIWETEGWVSLGRLEDRDWMHVQAAKR